MKMEINLKKLIGISEQTHIAKQCDVETKTVISQHVD